MWHRNSLSIVLGLLFLAFITAQTVSGWHVYNAERVKDGAAMIGLLAYLHSGHFISSTFENWESEFLQMGMYVVLTVKLRQAGSAESKPLDPADEEDKMAPGTTPWPVRKGGIWLKLYENSLAITFGALFLMSFCLHLYGSWRHELDERAAQHELPITIWNHLSASEFWFESFQNWQSEFLAVLSLVVLTIWLRQKDSPQSKSVAAPHSQTGS